jgi:hypothetical protein
MVRQIAFSFLFLFLSFLSQGQSENSFARNGLLKPVFLNREILPNENPVSLYQINDYTD